MLQQPLESTLFPYTTLFRSQLEGDEALAGLVNELVLFVARLHAAGRDRGLQRIGRVHALRLHDLLEVVARSEEHTSELQSRENLVCRLLFEKTRRLVVH